MILLSDEITYNTHVLPRSKSGATNQSINKGQLINITLTIETVMAVKLESLLPAFTSSKAQK